MYAGRPRRLPPRSPVVPVAGGCPQVVARGLAWAAAADQPGWMVTGRPWVRTWTVVAPVLVVLLLGPAPPAPPPGAGSVVPGARYGWPLLPAPTVLAGFGAPANPYGAGRRGVDLAGVVGQPVLAARAGTVVFAGAVAGQGVVAVDHDDGLRTTYEPLTPLVVGGQVVAAGAVLGLLLAGHPGCARVCLHWGVRRDRLTYLDPLVLLRPWRVRLLPDDGD